MKGNFHVQFLGEGVAATSPPYPTSGWATTQVYRPGLRPDTGLRRVRSAVTSSTRGIDGASRRFTEVVLNEQSLPIA